MASPDIRTIGGILGHVAIENNISTGSGITVLSNPSNSGHIYKINAIFAANTTTAFRTVTLGIDQGSGFYAIVDSLAVPYGATQIISTKETYFYLEEGHSIKAYASSAATVDIIVCYEVLSPTTNTLNLRNPANIYGKTKYYANVPTSLTNILEQSNSSKVFKINSIFATNYTTSSVRVDVQLSIRDADDTNLGTAYMAKNLLIPPNSTQIISTKETYFYLTAGSSGSSYIYAKTNTSSSVNMWVGYEEIEGTT